MSAICDLRTVETRRKPRDGYELQCPICEGWASWLLATVAGLMTPRRALALAVMACAHIADENQDIPDWHEAAVIRELLQKMRAVESIKSDTPRLPWGVANANAHALKHNCVKDNGRIDT